MNGFAMTTFSAVLLGVSAEHCWGVVAFVGVYVLLLVWLLLLPARVLDEPPGRPWWKRSRVWAVAIAVIQVLVYLGLG
ncbi:MAG: hypothetical protein JW888_14660 [Pirellulales bacterium]|nr:hypothetical protein [Pirellulales bacterium]